MKVRVEEIMVKRPLYRKEYKMDGVTANDLAVMFCDIYEMQFGKNVHDPYNQFYFNVRKAIEHRLDHQNYDWVNDPEGRLA